MELLVLVITLLLFYFGKRSSSIQWIKNNLVCQTLIGVGILLLIIYNLSKKHLDNFEKITIEILILSFVIGLPKYIKKWKEYYTSS